MCDSCNKCSENRVILPKITSAFLVLTESCNLKCKYCWVNQNPRHMTFEIAKKSVDFLIANSEIEKVIPNITFFGGEPLLKWEEIIVPIVNYIRNEYNKPFKINITSNCVLLTKDKMKFISDNGITLLFSIDGDRETQDYNRPLHGDGSSFNILENIIDSIPKYFPNTTFRSTIMPETSHFTFHNVVFAIEKGYPQVFSTPNVFTEWSKENKEILRLELRKIVDYYIDNLRKGRIIHYINLDEKIKDAININRIIKGKMKKNTFKCGLGLGHSCSINPEGVIIGCQEMSSYEDDTFIIGDIFKGVDDNKRYLLIDKFQKKHIEGTNCDTCKYKPICSGGCVANNYLINKDLNKMPSMTCYWNQLLLDEAIRVINIMGKEQNDLFKNKHFTGWGE